MIPITLLGLLAGFLFFNNINNQTKPTFSYKTLIKDFIDNHKITMYEWNNNMRITKDKLGFGIGSDDAFVVISDNKPVTLFLDRVEKSLETHDSNEAINKLIEMIKSGELNENDKKRVTRVVDLMLKFKDYYYYNKYLKYKNKYLSVKN